MNILVVFNTCGILPGDRTNTWINNLNSVLNQELSNDITIRVVLSDCLSSPEIRQKLHNYYGNVISYSFINEKVPIEPSFNKAVLSCVEKFGKFDGYMYVESGIELYDKNTINILCDYLRSNKYAMIATLPDTDIGFHYEDMPDLSQNYLVPVGKGINLHCQMFSSDYFNFYNRILPDIFAGHCMESVLSFCCAAIQKQWIVVANTRVKHTIEVDGQSIGFRPDVYCRTTGRPSWDHPYRLPSLIPIFVNKKALELGLGYEEARKIVMHNPNQYDEEFHCINDELKYYIKDNLFLNETLLNYSTIHNEFIP